MIDERRLRAAGLRFERADDVVTMTLDRPDRLNAQTPKMWAGMKEISRSLSGEIRIVVVRGAGDAFSSGLDLAAFGAATADDMTLMEIAALAEAEAVAVIASFQEAFSWLTRPDIVTVAAVQGYAIGAGFQLALACDLRVAADNAQFSMPEATRGLVPDLGGTRPLVRAVGYSRALEICLTGRRISAQEAHSLGLVNMVVPRAGLDLAVADCVDAIRATSRTTASELKALLSVALDQSAQRQLASEREAQVRRLKESAEHFE